MSVREVEHAIDTLSFRERDKVLHYLLQKQEDEKDLQTIREADEEGVFFDYMKVRKEILGNAADESD